MVYPGRLSHGCLACIARKVKCDEGKPECERCKKREQPCPGYRSPRARQLMRTAGRAKASSALPAGVASSSPRPPSKASFPHEAGPESTVLTPPLQQNFGYQAVNFWMHQFIIDAHNGGYPGFLDFVPELFEHSNPDDALAHSIRAISYTSLSPKSSVKVLVARGHEHYRTTLTRVSRMLESPEQTVQDSLIVAILLLVLFGNMTREKPAVMLNHAKGLHSVLLRRDEGQLLSPRGLSIFRQVLAHSQIRNIEMSRHPSPETISWLKDIDKSNPSGGSLWEKYRISQVRATAAERLLIPLAPGEVEEQLLPELEEAQELDSEIAIWTEHLPDACQPQAWKWGSNGVAEKIPGLPNAPSEQGDVATSFIESSPQLILTYANVWFASLWHGHRTSRLMLNETIIHLARRLNFPSAVQDVIKTIQQMVLETCTSIAFSLGDIQVRINELGHQFIHINIDSGIQRGGGAGAYFVIWTLRQVVSCEFASEMQIRESSEALVRIGAQFGVKQAFTLAIRQYQCHPSISVS